MQSGLSSRPRTGSVALSRGRGSPYSSRNSTNSSSSSDCVIPAGVFAPSTARRFAAPRRRGYRSSRSHKESRSVSPFTSASCIARSNPRFGRTAARSNCVRATEVTGIPSSSPRSSGGTSARWPRIALPLPRQNPGRVTSGTDGCPRHDPPELSGGPVTQYCSGPAGKNRRHPPRLGRRAGDIQLRKRLRCTRNQPSPFDPALDCPRPTPMLSSCHRATVPCCRWASSPIIRSTPRPCSLFARSPCSPGVHPPSIRRWMHCLVSHALTLSHMTHVWRAISDDSLDVPAPKKRPQPAVAASGFDPFQ